MVLINRTIQSNDTWIVLNIHARIALQKDSFYNIVLFD